MQIFKIFVQVIAFLVQYPKNQSESNLIWLQNSLIFFWISCSTVIYCILFNQYLTHNINFCDIDLTLQLLVILDVCNQVHKVCNKMADQRNYPNTMYTTKFYMMIFTNDLYLYGILNNHWIKLYIQLFTLKTGVTNINSEKKEKVRGMYKPFLMYC